MSAAAAGPALAHSVYFSLADASDQARQRLVAACRQHLAGHPGTLLFAAGTRAGGKRGHSTLSLSIVNFGA